MKILAVCAVFTLVTACNSSSSLNSIDTTTIKNEHHEILALQKYLTTQSTQIDQLSAIKLADIVDESDNVISELVKLDNSKSESERLGTFNVLAIKHSILLLAAQQIPRDAKFTAKY